MKVSNLVTGVAMASLLLAGGYKASAQKKKAPAPKPVSNEQKGPAAEKVTEVEGITEYLLPNGLKVLLFPDQSKATITVNATYLVGSRMEGYGETGMAHLLEHMMFKGSTNHPHVPDELTVHGSSPNGSTSYDRTNYFETFSATDENLNWALSLEADRMVNSFIAEKDLRSEFSVVRNEFESDENNADNILMERVISTMYLWHNYGKATIGSKEDIERVSIKSLQAFYKKYYQPDNTVLVVAGKIEPEKTLQLVTKYFGSIPRPTRVLDPTYTLEPAQDGERSVELRRVGDVQAVSVGFHIPSGTDKDYAAFDVLNDVLTNQPNGRLYQRLVKTGMASNVWSWDPALKDPAFLYINADVLQTRSLDSVRDEMLATLKDLKTNPVTADEVDKAKAKLKKNFEEVYRNTEYVGLTLSEYIAMGDWRLAFLYRDAVEKVTADDVNRIVSTYLIKSNRTMGAFIPTKDPKRVTVPEPPDIASLVKDYKGREALAQAEAFDATPANIDKRTERGVLPGGAKYALLSKTTRGNTVTAYVVLRMGNENALKNKAMIASLTAGMLKRGTTSKNMSQINEALDKLSSSVDIFNNRQEVTLMIKSTKENLPAVLDLINDILHHPSFPESEFATYKQENISSYEQQRSEPQNIAFLEYNRISTPRPRGDIDYTMNVDESEEDINKATVADVRDFYKNFYNGNSASVAFVGDFDVAMVKGKLNSMLGNWSSPIVYTRAPERCDDVASQNKEYKTPDKKNAMFVAGMNMKMRDDDPDYQPFMLGNFIFGGGFLNSRLATRIRQKEGVSYGVGSFAQVSSRDQNGIFASYAIYNPDNKAKVENAWNDELAKMLKDGFTEDELKQAKTGYLQYRQTGRTDDDQLADRLVKYVDLDRMLMWDQANDDRLKNLSLAEVNNAMKKYLSASKMIYVKAGDFK